MSVLSIIKEYLANSRNYGGTRSASTIQYIVIHYTGNDGDSDESNARYFRNNYVGASAHYFVDDDSITRSVPENRIAYSVGGKKYSNCTASGGGKYYGKATNRNTLNIELCDNKKDGKIYPGEKTIANALLLTEYLMKKYDIPKSHVIRHFDITGKNCPNYWVNNNKWRSEFYDRIGSSKASNSGVSSSQAPIRVTFIKDVQRATGASVDGIAGSETLSKTVTVSATTNRKHAVVKPLQTYLNALGYDCGTPDGIAGKKFTSAVNKYQKEVLGYRNPDGEITAKGKMWRSLLGL